MKYIKTFEKIWVGDYRMMLRDALIVFFNRIYGDSPGFTISEEAGAGFEVSMRKPEKKTRELWCDINIRSVDSSSTCEVNFDFFLYNKKYWGTDMYDFFAEKIDEPELSTDELFGCIKDVEKFIREELTKENFELFVAAKKYNV